MKSYTDIEQSKKLAEILPLESADMHYSKDFDSSWFVDLAEYTSVKIPKYVDNIEEHLLPCWSLSALLEIIPGSELSKSVDDIGKWEASAWKDPDLELLMRVEGFDNPIDACYDMILKLRELKIL